MGAAAGRMHGPAEWRCHLPTALTHQPTAEVSVTVGDACGANRLCAVRHHHPQVWPTLLLERTASDAPPTRRPGGIRPALPSCPGVINNTAQLDSDHACTAGDQLGAGGSGAPTAPTPRPSAHPTT